MVRQSLPGIALIACLLIPVCALLVVTGKRPPAAITPIQVGTTFATMAAN